MQISVDYFVADDKTYKDSNGNEVKLTFCEELMWSFNDNKQLLEIIKNSNKDFYNEIQEVIKENPNRKFDFNLSKVFRYDDEYIYFVKDCSKETLEEKLGNDFIVRYWTTDTDLTQQIDNFDQASQEESIITLNEELSEKLNSMVRDHVKNNIERFEQYKTYRNEQISKILYEEIKQHGEPSVSVDGNGKINARFQTLTTSDVLSDLLNLPRISWHDAKTGKTYPYQYALYADFELDENSIDKTKEPQIKYFEYIDNGEKKIHTEDSEKKDLSVLVKTDSMKIVTQVFKEIANDYYNQGKQYMQEQKDLTQEEQESQMYKKIHIRESEGFEKWTEYDDKGNEIYFKDSTGLEEWKEYDDKGNVIHFKNSDGLEEWKEYDEKGKLIHYKDSDGFEEWTEYDEKGNVIHFKDSDGLEEWKEYDDKGNLIHCKDSDGWEEWKEYDDKDNVIHFKNSTGWEEWTEYDDKGNLIHCKDSDGYEHWKEYDEKCNEIHFKNSNGFEKWTEYDENGNVIHYKNSDGFETWQEYDKNGNEIHFKNSDGYENWIEYDEKGNEIHFKDSDDFERWSTVEYLTKEQYMQEKNNSQIETKYTKADINDLQSFFIPYPQLSEVLCYQILDDFELYQIPLFKDSDGNIYQREMNTDLAAGDESDYQLLTQDGIIDQEYNWLIDRKYTSEDEIDLQKELEDIKKFEENPKSYYKNIFKIALEKEIEKVKKEINEGNVKDVIEKNILEIAEEKVGSHAVPEEIIGWYISDDEKNYFENWKNSGDFPYYKEALDSMFAYVYEHDTTKQNLRYVSELNESTQNKLKTLLQEHFEKEGLSEGEINTAIQNAIDSKIDDLNQLMESNAKIKSLLTNSKEWQQAVYEWNEKKEGGNEEFFPIGNLVDVDFTNEEQIQKIIEKDNFFNTEQAKALLRMVNYDKDSFEFMFDSDNGNFVEIDKKNNKIVAVSIPRSILGYLDYEVHYRLEEEQTDSFTIEDLYDANVLSELFINIKKEPKYYEVEEVRLSNGDIIFCPYTSANLNRFLDKEFSTIEACEVFCRKENAFEIAKKYLNEIDESKEYDEFQKSNFVKTLINQLNQGWNEYDNHPSDEELEDLIKGIDAFEYGEDSLSFIRPDADDIENGFENGWDFPEICKGYAEFADGYNESKVICRLDDMMIFDSDFDAALQAKKDGYKFLEVGKDIIFPKEMLNEEIEYGNYIDTPENRKILNKYLIEDLKKTQMYKIIYKQSSQGIEEWHEYDPKGNEIHYKDSNGVEEWIEYDSNGNKIHYKNSDGYEEWAEYDDKGNEIHSKDSDGYEEWAEYDDKGNQIHSKNSDNLETQHEYDSNGNEIYSKRSDDYEQWYEYDSNGNKIHYKDSESFEQWYEYNSNGKEIHYKDSHSFEYWKEYDSKGNVIHYKDATGFERWLKYDSNGNHIYSKDSNGSEKWSIVEYFTKEQYLLEKNEAVQQIINKASSMGGYSGEYELNDLTQEEQESQMYKKICIKKENGLEDLTIYNENGNKIYHKNSDGYETWTEYDDEGNKIHYKNSNGFEEWTEYDNKGNEIHFKNSDGYECWNEYDEKSNVIHYKNSNGYEKWNEYDENGNVIHHKNSDGFEHWQEYDKNSNEIHYKDSNGVERWTEYNDKDNVIYSKDSDGFERWNEYDDKGNEIHFKNSEGIEIWNEYDDKGNHIHYKDSDGYEKWTDYDEKGNQIHYKDSDGYERWNEYDEKGNVIHFKNSNGFEKWTEYDENGNVIHYKNSDGFETWREYDDKGNEIHFKNSEGKEKWTTVEYVTKEQYLQEKTNNESLTFGQFNSDTNEIKLIKEAYFKELVIDENDASKNKVILGFKENDQEQLLEMGEGEYKNLLNAFGFSKEQQENTLEINKYKTFAEEKPEVVFDMIKSNYLGGTSFSDNELIGYLKGLKKSNNYHHYLDELLFESLEQSDESLFSKVVDAGADLTWRREENGEPINILHYAAADNLSEAVQITINKLSEEVELINLLMEENYEGKKPFEVSIDNFSIEYHETQENLLDTLSFERDISSFLFKDESGNQLLYEVKNNGGVERILFDYNNEIVNYDVIYNDNSFGKIVFDDLSQQIKEKNFNESFIFDNTINNIEKLQNIPQKLWNDEINYRILETIPNIFNPQKSFYDFDSILALEKIKKSIFEDFDNQKESLLQGTYTKDKFVNSFKEKELSFEGIKTCDLKNFFEDDNWSPVHNSFKADIAALCFDKKINELFDTISPRPNVMGMYKNNDYTCLSLKISAASNNRPITEDEAEIILKYIQYENFNFYESMNNELCMLDVSEDFTGEGEIMTPEKIVDMAHRMMVKARDEEYSIYDVTDEKVINDLQERFGLIEEQQIESSKDEELKKQETSVVEQFFSKLKDSLYDNAKLEDVLKSAATVLQTFSDTEKKEISQYLHDKGASSGDRVGKVLSSILKINEPEQKKKRSDDFSPSL